MRSPFGTLRGKKAQATLEILSGAAIAIPLDDLVLDEDEPHGALLDLLGQGFDEPLGIDVVAGKDGTTIEVRMDRVRVSYEVDEPGAFDPRFLGVLNAALARADRAERACMLGHDAAAVALLAPDELEAARATGAVVEPCPLIVLDQIRTNRWLARPYDNEWPQDAFAAAVAARLGTDGAAAIERWIARLVGALGVDGTAKLPGFGKFAIRPERQRAGRARGREVAIGLAGGNRIEFRAGQQLKDALSSHLVDARDDESPAGDPPVAGDAIDVAVTASITAALVAGHDAVRLPKLGVLRSRSVGSDTARNPRTGEPVAMAAHTVVTFKQDSKAAR